MEAIASRVEAIGTRSKKLLVTRGLKPSGLCQVALLGEDMHHLLKLRLTACGQWAGGSAKGDVHSP